MTSAVSAKQKLNPPKENLWVSILLNVVLPVFILTKLTSVFGPLKTLLIALVFPLAYAVYDYVRRRQANPIAILGAVSVLLKGIFAFYQVNAFWFAVEIAIIPTFLGVFTIVSAWVGRPIVNYFIYNENVFNMELLESKLDERNVRHDFQRLIWQVTIVFGFVFFLGGILNFLLARQIIVSPAGTAEFNKELAEMTWRGYLIILLPKVLITMFGLWWFVHNLKKMTGLDLGKILKE